jgi:hypothetical protein
MHRAVTASAALVFVLSAGVVSAAPALAVVVPPHDHWVTTGSDDVVHVGPDVCANPEIYDAWLNFHLNVHRGIPGTQAFVIDSNPVSISATGCVS